MISLVECVREYINITYRHLPVSFIYFNIKLIIHIIKHLAQILISVAKQFYKPYLHFQDGSNMNGP
jgi:hypothetical protein